ncbi:MAG: hypothetical protein DHS20C18_54260 [Saprospiraceae bacterium]|nr:MAG: hypothetical protein DHS20C18_54260 [Saprospiraceae bacterium]
MYRLISLLFIIIFLCQCAVPAKVQEANNEYMRVIESWRKDREERLKAPNSWLALVGLFPLKEGANTFGSASDNDLVFPAKAAAKLGTLTLSGNTVRMALERGVKVNIGATIAEDEIIIFQDNNAETIRNESFTWTVIQRADQYFLRLWDAKNEAIQQFTGIDYFPIRKEWRLAATFVEKQRTLAINNVLDMSFNQVSEGILRFQLKGKTCELITLDGGPDSFFLIFSDETTGEETYGGGRYLYVDRPDEEGKTWIDFNKAYNPPCVYTPFATCPLPPKENHLMVAIQAGEKDDMTH